jgi:O-antigen ligase
MRRLAFWMIVAVAFTLPSENVLGVPGVGTVSRAVGLAAAAVWILAVLGTATVRRPGPVAIAVAFVAWNGFSVFWSVDVDVSIGRVFTFVQLLVMMYLLWDTVRTSRDFRIVLQAYVVGSLVTLTFLIRDALVDGPIGYQVRYTVGDFQYDDLGLVFALAVPMAFHLATTPTSGRRGRLLQALNIALVPAATIGIMFSGSRAAMVAVVPSLVYVFVTLARLRPWSRAVSSTAILVTFLILIQLVPQSTVDRLVNTSGDRTSGDLNGRVELWSQAYLTFKQHPFTGVGTGAFREDTSWKVAHDVWLRFAAELGIVGLGLFLLLLAVLYARSWHAPRALRNLALTLMTAWMIGATFYNAEDKKQTWLVLSLVLIGASLPREPASSPATDDQEAMPGLDVPPDPVELSKD